MDVPVPTVSKRPKKTDLLKDLPSLMRGITDTFIDGQVGGEAKAAHMTALAKNILRDGFSSTESFNWPCKEADGYGGTHDVDYDVEVCLLDHLLQYLGGSGRYNDQDMRDLMWFSTATCPLIDWLFLVDPPDDYQDPYLVTPREGYQGIRGYSREVSMRFTYWVFRKGPKFDLIRQQLLEVEHE